MSHFLDHLVARQAGAGAVLRPIAAPVHAADVADGALDGSEPGRSGETALPPGGPRPSGDEPSALLLPERTQGALAPPPPPPGGAPAGAPRIAPGALPLTAPPAAPPGTAPGKPSLESLAVRREVMGPARAQPPVEAGLSPVEPPGEVASPMALARPPPPPDSARVVLQEPGAPREEPHPAAARRSPESVPRAAAGDRRGAVPRAEPTGILEERTAPEVRRAFASPWSWPPELRAPAIRSGEDAPPEIHVTIGRVEIRGAAGQAPPAAPRTPARPASPTSLDAYLARRSGKGS